MPFSSSNIYAVHLFDLLYSCKNWMDLQAKTSQKCKPFSGLLIHLDKKKSLKYGIGYFIAKRMRKAWNNYFYKQRRFGGVFFLFFFIQKPVIHLLYIQQVLWISKLLNISKAQAILFTFDKWHTLKQFAINRQGNCCIDSSLLL